MTSSAEGGARPLLIKSLEFMGGLTAEAGFRPPDDLPVIAFAGRSNVGKSSLLNRLVGRRAIARVSKTPGRTREINFFLVNGAFVLADLPGYGYARVSASVRDSWRPLMQKYLSSSVALRGVVLLLDVRRDPSEDDLLMLDFLAELGTPVVAAITKVDKLSRLRVQERFAEIERRSGLEIGQMIPFSSTTGLGRDELASAIEELLLPLPESGVDA